MATADGQEAIDRDTASSSALRSAGRQRVRQGVDGSGHYDGAEDAMFSGLLAP